MQFVLTLFLMFFAHAQDPYKVTKATWVSEMQVGTQENFCAEKSYFRTCLALSAANCKFAVKSHFKKCTETLALPLVVNVLGNGKELGAKLGDCLGKKMDLQFESQKISDPKCYSRDTKW